MVLKITFSAENDFNSYLLGNASSGETLDVATTMAPKLKDNPETNPSFVPNLYKMEDKSISPDNTQDYIFKDDVFLSAAENDFNSYLLGNASSGETLDVATTMAPNLKDNPETNPSFVPSYTRGPPQKINEEFAAFRLEIDGSQTRKRNFLYSKLLHRIFIKPDCNFSITFKWDESKVPQKAMYVRATVVFADPEQAEKRVELCLQHAHAKYHEKTTDPVVINNVLKSAREMGDPNVFYCGNPDETDVWYSVVVKLNGPTSHAYNFVCMNSCGTGINRRTIEIIFTLEDAMGKVFGRQWVGVHISWAIWRDLQAQERAFLESAGKRALPRKQQPAKKKKKLEVDRAASVPNTDTEVVRLPEMVIVGPLEAISSLKVAHRIIAQMRAIEQTHQKPVEGLDRCIDNIKNTIQKLEEAMENNQKNN